VNGAFVSDWPTAESDFHRASAPAPRSLKASTSYVGSDSVEARTEWPLSINSVDLGAGDGGPN